MSHARLQRRIAFHAAKPIQGDVRGFAVDVGRSAPLRRVLRVDRSDLDAETSDTRRVRYPGMQVRPREAQEVTGLDDDPQLRGTAGLAGAALRLLWARIPSRSQSPLVFFTGRDQ